MKRTALSQFVRRTPPISKRWVNWASLILASACLCCVAEAQTIARLSSVEGGSAVSGKAGWMDLTAVGVDFASNSADLEGLLKGLRQGKRFTFQKRIDKASPYLARGSMARNRFDELRVEQYRDEQFAGGFRLRGVRLGAYRLFTKESNPTIAEEVGVEFDVIEWHYFRRQGGGPVHVGSTWNFAVGAGDLIEGYEVEPPTIAPLAPIVIEPGGSAQINIQLFASSGINPDGLIFSVLPSSSGLVQVVEVAGQGATRSLVVKADYLLNGRDEVLFSVSDGTRSSTRILPILVSGAPTKYEAFVEGFLAEELQVEPSSGGLLRDPDGDGMSNIIEFFLGSHPGEFTHRNEALKFARIDTPQGKAIRIRYQRRIDTPGLNEIFAGSAELESWKRLDRETTPYLVTRQLGDGDGTYAPFESTILVGDAPSYFMRFSIEGSFQ